VEVELADAVDE
jgi:hypothetical protein